MESQRPKWQNSEGQFLFKILVEQIVRSSYAQKSRQDNFKTIKTDSAEVEQVDILP
jgi:hypothetical protein